MRRRRRASDAQSRPIQSQMRAWQPNRCIDTWATATRTLGPWPSPPLLFVGEERCRPEYGVFSMIDRIARCEAKSQSDPATTLERVTSRQPVPRDRANDYTNEQATARRRFAGERTGADLTHVAVVLIRPDGASGNIENFIGVAQVPIGLAGPLRVNGEHASGDYYIPLATTEGTLVASYNRACGCSARPVACGQRWSTTACRERRCSCSTMRSRRANSACGSPSTTTIAAAAESTTSIGKLIEIEQYAVGPLRYLRFDYTTGDAAGQNMVGRATWAARMDSRESSGLPALRALRRHRHRQEALADQRHAHPWQTCGRGGGPASHPARADDGCDAVATVPHAPGESGRGTLAGTANNGAHAANGLAALFIATGQDVANVAESHAAMVYSQLLDNGDYYWSITLPALIVATVGGGTGLQHSSANAWSCSTAWVRARHTLWPKSAPPSCSPGGLLEQCGPRGDWVTSHERMGRNRG